MFLKCYNIHTYRCRESNFIGNIFITKIARNGIAENKHHGILKFCVEMKIYIFKYNSCYSVTNNKERSPILPWVKANKGINYIISIIALEIL